jgi:hypothetical protein
MESEQGRLEKLYGEMGDEHLLDLADDMDNLRDEARMALAQELKRRGIVPEPPAPRPIVPEVEPERETGFGAGVPGILPGGADMMEQALEPAQKAKDGMSALITLFDGIELGKACDLVEDERMEPVIDAVAGDALSGVAPRFVIWLKTEQIEPAKALLRAKMGLFPLAEVDADDGNDAAGEDAGEFVVAGFESMPEAEQAKAFLTAAGIHARVEVDDEDEGVAVLVAAADQERALEVLTERMGLE